MSKPLGAELMKKLRTEYEKLSPLGYENELLHEKLKNAYQNFMTAVSAS